ncbi:MAG: TolC family protein [Parachlamydia sp.]|nr:TolC family protein [Parachlamydia sp.]
MLKIISKAFCLLLCLILSGCLWRDPVDGEWVAASPETVWRAPVVEAIPNPVVPIPEDHPLKVAEMVDIALRYNPTTANTWATARASAFNWLASQSILYPTIDFQETFTHTDESAFAVNSSTNNTNVTPNPVSRGGSMKHFNSFSSLFTLQYLLLDFGGRDASIEATLHALFSSNWIHNRSLQDVTINVMDSYYAYINAVELLHARLDDLKDSKANLDAAEEQLRSGVSTRIDYLQAKSNYVNVQLSVEQLKGQVEVTHGQLAAALGLAANARFQVEPLPEKLPLDQVNESVEELLDTAKRLRPDLAATYAIYKEQIANLHVAQSNALPTISLESNYLRNTFPSNSAINNHQYSNSVVLSVPIFTGFLHLNQIRGAREQVIASYTAMEEKMLSVELEVVTNYYAYKTAVQTLKYSEEYLKFAEESYNATLQGYRSGIQTFVDLLVAQAVLSNARAQHVTARTNWVTSLANLSYSTGTL